MYTRNYDQLVSASSVLSRVTQRTRRILKQTREIPNREPLSSSYCFNIGLMGRDGELKRDQ